MRFFKIKYTENAEYMPESMERERYVILEDEPKKGTTIESHIGIELTTPYTTYGSISGGSVDPYRMFVPIDAEIEELSLDEFIDVVIESVRKNYISKTTLKSTTDSLLKSTW